jgi:hypothetical protein
VEVQQRNLEAQIEVKIGQLQQARVELHAALRTHYSADPAQAEAYFYRWQRTRSRATTATTTTTTTTDAPA